jgi:hypothetical protein
MPHSTPTTRTSHAVLFRVVRGFLFAVAATGTVLIPGGCDRNSDADAPADTATSTPADPGQQKPPPTTQPAPVPPPPPTPLPPSPSAPVRSASAEDHLRELLAAVDAEYKRLEGASAPETRPSRGSTGPRSAGR